MSTEGTMAVPIPDTLIFIHLDGLRNMKLLHKKRKLRASSTMEKT